MLPGMAAVPGYKRPAARTPKPKPAPRAPWAKKLQAKNPTVCDVCAASVLAKLGAGERTYAPRRAAFVVSDGKGPGQPLCAEHAADRKRRLGLK